MRNWFPICRGGVGLAAIAAGACSLVGCMSYGEAVVYRLYQTNADRCAQNETDACVAMLQSSCEAPARLCTDYVPTFQAQASKQLSKQCRSNDEAACQALDAVACDRGDTRCAIASAIGTRSCTHRASRATRAIASRYHFRYGRKSRPTSPTVRARAATQSLAAS